MGYHPQTKQNPVFGLVIDLLVFIFSTPSNIQAELFRNLFVLPTMACYIFIGFRSALNLERRWREP